MTDASFQVPPLRHPQEEEHRYQLALAMRRLFDAKVNTVSTVTLTANAATTTITDNRIGANTIAVLVPTTANAAAALATTYQTLPNAANGSAVLNHASNAQSDKTFGVLLIG